MTTDQNSGPSVPEHPGVHPHQPHDMTSGSSLSTRIKAGWPTSSPLMRPRLADTGRAQSRCAATSRPDQNEKRLFEWEMREHEPCALHANALCAHFDVASVGELGLGHTRVAARNCT